MKLWEYDLRLYRELKTCIQSGEASPLRDQPDAAMWAGLLHNFKSLRVGKHHACGDSACRSFYSPEQPARDVKLFRVRFEVCGELTVQCDAAGHIYYVEWLPEDPRPTRKRYVFV
jgi:hypothetical protein